MGGRLRSQPFEGADGVVAELGGMRFPVSGTGFFHYADLVGLESAPFPNPLAPATPSTVIDLAGESVYVEKPEELPRLLVEVQRAWQEALEHGAQFSDMQAAIRARNVRAIKSIWNRLVPIWDDRTFYGFIATSDAFVRRSFRHLEVFGQVGFGTGGWDTDFPNSMLEILRVVYTNCDEDQRLIVGGAEQLPRRLWKHAPAALAHWPAGTTLETVAVSHQVRCHFNLARFAVRKRKSERPSSRRGLTCKFKRPAPAINQSCNLMRPWRCEPDNWSCWEWLRLPNAIRCLSSS